MTQSDIQSRIQEKFPNSHVEVKDLTGTADHYQVLIMAPQFSGKSMIDQHRMVKALFEADIASGDLHALSLKTYTPDEWAKKGGL